MRFPFVMFSNFGSSSKHFKKTNEICKESIRFHSKLNEVLSLLKGNERMISFLKSVFLLLLKIIILNKKKFSLIKKFKKGYKKFHQNVPNQVSISLK